MLQEILKYLLVCALTIAASFAIIKYGAKVGLKRVKRVVISQSTNHNRIKHLLPQDRKHQKNSQLHNHMIKHMIRIIVIEGKAYWIKNNSFFVADMDNGQVVAETTRQINESDISEADLDKMLFILDKLRGEQ